MIASLGMVSGSDFGGAIDAGLFLDLGDSPASTEARPDSEHVAAYGVDTWMTPWPFERYEPFLRLQDHRTLKAMMRCPPVKSSLAALKSTVLAGGFQLTPSVQPAEDGADDPEADLSLQILEECKRSAARMDRPMEVWAWEMLDAMALRHKMSEIVMEAIEDGPDSGKYGLKALKVKPRWSYRFRVDRALNVTAIDCYTVDGEWKSFDPGHFAWFAWEPQDSDPRGSSVLDSCYQAFEMLQRLWPEFWKGNKQFGTPRTFGTTGEKSAPTVTPRDSRGQEIQGAKPVTQEYAMARQLAQTENGSTVVGTHGSTAKVLESTRDQAGMNAAMEVLSAEITICILLTTRSTKEAQFGSKADAENGTNVVTTFAQVVRQALCAVPRKAFFALVEANHGTEIARRHTPHVGLGKIDPRNFAAIAQAIGVLYQSGFFTEAQMIWLDGYLGLPIRRPGDSRIGPQKDNAAASADPAMILQFESFKGMFADIKTLLMERGMPA